MSAPLGNDNASKKNRMFSDELRKMYVQQRRDIVKACEALADKAEDGDIMAIRELADRLEGKVPTAIEGTGSNGEIILKITSDDTTVL